MASGKPLVGAGDILKENAAPVGTLATAFDPCLESRVARSFVEGLVSSPGRILTAIHAADDMYRYNLDLLRGSRPCAAVLYYAKGWQIFQTVQRVAACGFGELRRVPRLLDFASGHGRVTRFLTAQIESDRVWAADIHEDAVSFQRDYFGVRGLLSSTEPAQFECETSFPLILASSFFSHVAPAAFSSWIRALLRCLEPEGLFLFSTLSCELLSDPEAAGKAGAFFVAESETSRLDRSVYGTIYVTEEFVRAAIVGACGRAWTVRRFRRALCALQDVYLVAPADAKAMPFEPVYLPWGDADRYCLSHARALEIAGWIRRVEEGSDPELVEFRVNNRTIAVVRPEQTDACAYRWSFEVDCDAVDPDDVLMVVAQTSEGFENLIGLGTMRTHPPETR